jgi:hypothetical protein
MRKAILKTILCGALLAPGWAWAEMLETFNGGGQTFAGWLGASGWSCEGACDRPLISTSYFDLLPEPRDDLLEPQNESFVRLRHANVADSFVSIWKDFVLSSAGTVSVSHSVRKLSVAGSSHIDVASGVVQKVDNGVLGTPATIFFQTTLLTNSAIWEHGETFVDAVGTYRITFDLRYLEGTPTAGRVTSTSLQNLSFTPVPLPPAAWLLASALGIIRVLRRNA